MKAIVTVIGQDKTGIIAKVSSCLYEFNVNIEDISQTIMQDRFTMVMFVDLSKTKEDIGVINLALEKIASELGLSIRIQNEAIFQAMQRI